MYTCTSSSHPEKTSHAGFPPKKKGIRKLWSQTTTGTKLDQLLQQLNSQIGREKSPHETVGNKLDSFFLPRAVDLLPQLAREISLAMHPTPHISCVLFFFLSIAKQERN